ncbi:nuclear factor interleukin-3-regulated protein-like [Paramacrobiotus metropolitanus]|uniref:nuclear factor interleukin-3-regulated protein-like n=1 Tax=Paramacrobiotus metropolitanus TaxID=2943436 RepID=UPI002445E435|nr:nuclear factor interleukin-3-regulated protein-like [Paramacrobiotus metropolitanus]
MSVMAAIQRSVVGYKEHHGSGSIGSAEDDSMSGSDGSGSPAGSIVDFHGQPAQILLQYDTSTGQFTDPGLIKPQVVRREKRPFPNTFDALNHLTSFGAADPLAEANPVLIRAISSMNSSASSTSSRRQRSEKKPIPSEQKDDKYYERRRRNNYAAKKSRDFRKAREDEIAMRACYLEKENAVLKAQLTTLRDEAEALKNMLLQKRQQHAQHQTATLSRYIGQLTLPAHLQ